MYTYMCFRIKTYQKTCEIEEVHGASSCSHVLFLVIGRCFGQPTSMESTGISKWMRKRACYVVVHGYKGKPYETNRSMAIYNLISATHTLMICDFTKK